jgi:predicted TIM-barrel fold metal-dependent hydrolase
MESLRKLAMLPIIDCDTHLAESPTLWTDRLASKWGDLIPRVVHDERRKMDRWQIGDRRVTGVANWATAGWPEYPPSFPPTKEQADAGAFDAEARLAWMDRNGIYSQVLFPNLLTFSVHAFLSLKDPALMLECVQAYNDYQVEFASANPDRFVLLTALPFWDIKACVREIERCYDIGHRGILLMSKPYKLGLPRLADDHWEPVLSAAREARVSVNFHVGYQEMTEEELRGVIGRGHDRADYVKESSLSIIGLAEGLAEVVTSGLCERYPDLPFVLVESGFGWLPFFAETLDWQWQNSGAQAAYPKRLMPSEYIKRQVYGSFWYESHTVSSMGESYADNLMFETDYPHATSLSPGPASSARTPWKMATEAVAGLSLASQRKVLYGNAAKIYDVKVPATVALPA